MYSDPVRCVYLKHLPDMRKPVQLSAACVMCELAGTCDDVTPQPGPDAELRRAESCTLAPHPEPP